MILDRVESAAPRARRARPRADGGIQPHRTAPALEPGPTTAVRRP
jgi:hypothetical protein